MSTEVHSVLLNPHNFWQNQLLSKPWQCYVDELLETPLHPESFIHKCHGTACGMCAHAPYAFSCTHCSQSGFNPQPVLVVAPHSISCGYVCVSLWLKSISVPSCLCLLPNSQINRQSKLHRDELSPAAVEGGDNQWRRSLVC